MNAFLHFGNGRSTSLACPIPPSMAQTLTTEEIIQQLSPTIERHEA